VLGRRNRHRLRRRVEQDRRDVDAGDPVDERVMGLGQQREAVIGQPLDEPQLPQRASAIQRLREHATGQALELPVAAWPRQRRMTDVEVDVEVRIVHPHRAPLVERHEGQPLSVARHQVQPGDDLGDQFFIGRRRALEHHAAGHVHVGGVSL
jgi:hypothetical protein